MEPRKLHIFKHSKGIYLNYEQRTLIVTFFVLAFVLFLQRTFGYDFGLLNIAIIIIWCILVFGIMIIRFFRYEFEFGEYIGHLVFRDNSLELNNSEISISDISKIEFRANDIRGESKHHRNPFAPYLSHGLDNEFTILLKNGDKKTGNFLQAKGNRLKFFKEPLIHYHKQGLIGWLHLLDLLEMDDYGRIQDFKKELNNYGQHRL